MKNKQKKSRNILKKVSLIIGLVIMILSGTVYRTNIYDWFTNKPTQQTTSSPLISQIQNGTNNVQNISINESKENNRTTTNTKSGQKLKLSFRRFDTVSINQSYIGKDGKKYTTHYLQRPIKRSPHELLYFLGFMLILIFGAGYFLYKMEKLDHDKK